MTGLRGDACPGVSYYVDGKAGNAVGKDIERAPNGGEAQGASSIDHLAGLALGSVEEVDNVINGSPCHLQESPLFAGFRCFLHLLYEYP